MEFCFIIMLILLQWNLLYPGSLVLGSARNSDLPISRNIVGYSLVDHAFPLAMPTAPPKLGV